LGCALPLKTAISFIFVSPADAMPLFGHIRQVSDCDCTNESRWLIGSI
jgi:hypothetical protein